MERSTWGTSVDWQSCRPNDLEIREITTDDGLPQRTPQATFVDTRNRVWLGTWGGGVVQVDGDRGPRPRHACASRGGSSAPHCGGRSRTYLRGDLFRGFGALTIGGKKSRRRTPSAQVKVVAAIPRTVADTLIRTNGVKIPAGRANRRGGQGPGRMRTVRMILERRSGNDLAASNGGRVEMSTSAATECSEPTCDLTTSIQPHSGISGAALPAN